VTEDKWILRAIVFTLCTIALMFVVAFCKGLFDPSVSNADIFKIVGPTFQTVTGGLLVLLTQMLGKKP
jgi:hypothetical protein